ncbi:Acyl-CoA thioesterase 8 [Entomortierella beljakovae]|nr:Acyl-CoA thioesterase 8 [Entomortierella beljakovae]
MSTSTYTQSSDPIEGLTIAESVLQLDQIDTNLFHSKKLWIPYGGRGANGGNIVGLSLRAAIMTVDPQFQAHSINCYFLLPASGKTPVEFHVDRLRDGKQICTRSVTAKQGGKSILVCTASFQIPQLDTSFHFYPMPDVPHHSKLKSYNELLAEFCEDPSTPKENVSHFKIMLKEPVPNDLKITSRQTYKDFMNSPGGTTQCFWIRSKGNLGDDPIIHQCVAAYESDVNFLDTVVAAYGGSWLSIFGSDPLIRSIYTINHTVYFHCPFRADEWMLFVCETSRTGEDRALVFGRMYKEDGALAVSVVQEGSVRFRPGSKVIERPRL